MLKITSGESLELDGLGSMMPDMSGEGGGGMFLCRNAAPNYRMASAGASRSRSRA